VTHTDQES